MANSKHTGDLTESKALAKLLRHEHTVSIPFGDNSKYDLVVDDGRKLHRIQCKTAWQNKTDTIRFNTHSQTTHRGEYHEASYEGAIDAFLVRAPDRNQFYWIDIDEAGSQKMELRFDAEIDHPSINWAADYEFTGSIPRSDQPHRERDEERQRE